jgi:16S rRNA (cytidine1402-2'-O)-methyltransferase
MVDSGGTLFVVATPIGNLGDITARAVETLRTCDRVVAEDTRRTRQLLSHLGISGKRVDRLDAHASLADCAHVIDHLRTGERIALVTDAGTPGVSDPGERVIAAAIGAGIGVMPIPGASAVLSALVASGLAGDGRFRFFGFIPRSGAARREVIGLVSETPETVILFEAANRTAGTLGELADATPQRPACVARELTKRHEELVRGTCEMLAADGREWIGEIALVLGPHEPGTREAQVDEASIDARIDAGLARGDHARTVAERLAAWSGRPRRELYERVVTRKAQHRR